MLRFSFWIAPPCIRISLFLSYICESVRRHCRPPTPALRPTITFLSSRVTAGWAAPQSSPQSSSDSRLSSGDPVRSAFHAILVMRENLHRQRHRHSCMMNLVRAGTRDCTLAAMSLRCHGNQAMACSATRVGATKSIWSQCSLAYGPVQATACRLTTGKAGACSNGTCAYASLNRFPVC